MRAHASASGVRLDRLGPVASLSAPVAAPFGRAVLAGERQSPPESLAGLVFTGERGDSWLLDGEGAALSMPGVGAAALAEAAGGAGEAVGFVLVACMIIAVDYNIV